MSNKIISWQVNERIHAPTVRVIDKNGKNLGIMSIDKALVQARKSGLDLIEIAPIAKPPVAKIINFGKFRYQEEKKAKQQKKGVKGGELKEIRFSPFIGEADYKTRLERVKEFLEDKDKVRLVVKFKGRQMGSKQFGYSLLKRVLDELGKSIAVDMEPKFLGRHLIMVISPYGKSKKEIDQESENENAKTKN